MKRKAKEIQMAKKEMQRSGGGGRYGSISECSLVWTGICGCSVGLVGVVGA